MGSRSRRRKAEIYQRGILSLLGKFAKEWRKYGSGAIVGADS